MGRNRAVFLDRDGTINRDYGYIHTMDRFELLPGVEEGLRALQDAGFFLIVVTNQSGVARGYFTKEEYMAFEGQIDRFLQERGINLTATYHCPHLEEGCGCRKPRTGLFYRAAEDYNIDFSASYAIGDRERDLSICLAEPVTGVLVREGGNAECFSDAVEFILSLERDGG